MRAMDATAIAIRHFVCGRPLSHATVIKETDVFLSERLDVRRLGGHAHGRDDLLHRFPPSAPLRPESLPVPTKIGPRADLTGGSPPCCGGRSAAFGESPPRVQ
jgi:hypothetical protein